MTYRYKRTPSGLLLERKARCALRGDLMIPGLHFNPNHTTAFMADKATVGLTFAITAALKLQLDHFDIKSAFIQEPYKFTKPVYVKQHQRFDCTYKHTGKGGLLTKNIYGGPSGSFYYLKGAEEFLSSIGFSQCQSDPCLFILNDKRGFLIIALNIDDFLVASNQNSLIDWLHRQLKHKYPSKVKRMGTPAQYLGWKVEYLPTGAIKLSQPQYVIKALNNARMSDTNGRSCPHVDGTRYHPPTEFDKCTPSLRENFQATLGELRYIADCTRPDIVYYVNRLATATHRPTRRHWLIMKNILRYLKQTASHGIIYHPLSPSYCHTTTSQSPQHPEPLTSFSDADFARDIVGRKSISGAIHLFNKSPFSCTSNKQTITALSTCESEYIAAISAVQTTNCLRKILTEMQLPPVQATPSFVDNQAAIAIARNQAPTRKRKCLDVKFHFLQDHLRRGTIDLPHVSTHDILADLFTKPLGPTNLFTSKPSSTFMVENSNSKKRLDLRESGGVSLRAHRSSHVQDSRTPATSSFRVITRHITAFTVISISLN